MVLKVAKRGTIPPFIVMDVMREANEREAQGEDVLHLEVGQPGTGAPGPVLEAAKAVLDKDRLGYTDALGLPALKRRIARHYQDAYGLEVDPERVVVTTGSSGGFVLSFLAAFDAGDRVALSSPGYPAYRNILRGVGCEVVDIQVGPDTNFQPTPELIDRAVHDSAAAIDGLIIASPSNPTGRVIPRAWLEAFAEFARRRDLWLISDEVYEDYVYRGERVSPGCFAPERTLSVYSFSKAYGMAGNRVGYLVGPPELIAQARKIGTHIYYHPPIIGQRTAIAAIEGGEEWIESARSEYRTSGARVAELLGDVVADKRGGVIA
ncbi:MAG: aminotransferase class I/II-fold pyridoxal phosphate-dependent enzyme, partial [Proteobacteria bacterium]|nr:aminotransferase class I/II-fold pyridoxal phosphate-dependent enzyme [Pseudomonadota bacterium]